MLTFPFIASRYCFQLSYSFRLIEPEATRPYISSVISLHSFSASGVTRLRGCSISYSSRQVLPFGTGSEQYSSVCSSSRTKYLPQRLHLVSQPPLSMSASISRSTTAFRPHGMYTLIGVCSIAERDIL